MSKSELKKRQRFKAQRHALLLSYIVMLLGCSDTLTVDSEFKLQQESFRWDVELLDPSDTEKNFYRGVTYHTPDAVIIGIQYKNLSDTEVSFSIPPAGFDSIIRLIDAKTSTPVETYTEKGIEMRTRFEEHLHWTGSRVAIPFKAGHSFVYEVNLSDYFHMPSGHYYVIIERRADEVCPQGKFRTPEFSIRE